MAKILFLSFFWDSINDKKLNKNKKRIRKMFAKIVNKYIKNRLILNFLVFFLDHRFLSKVLFLYLLKYFSELGVFLLLPLGYLY